MAVLVLLAGCGGELSGGEERTTRDQELFSHNLFWNKMAYIIVDDDEDGYRDQADALTTALGQRKYLVRRVNHTNAVATIRSDFNSRSMILNKVLLVAAGHGSHVDYDNLGIFASNWADHRITVGKSPDRGTVTTGQLVQLATEMRQAGKAVVIIDGSCQGGATVQEVEAQFAGDNQICAIATTGVVTPSVVGFPPYQNKIGSYQSFAQIGRWATRQLLDAAHGTAGAPPNHRVHQYGYMNGCSASMRLREGLRVAAGGLSTWPLHNRQRYNHVFLEPERYRHPDRNDPSSPHYAPPPDPAAAAAGFSKYTLRDINLLKFENVIFKGQGGGTVSVKVGKAYLYNKVKGEVLPALKKWQDAFKYSDIHASVSLLGQPLGKRIAYLVSHPTCSRPWFDMSYPKAERDKLRRYYHTSCTNPDALVGEVLKDYPLLAVSIQKTQAAEQAALAAIIAVSKKLAVTELELCNPTGCAAISL